MPGRRRLSRDVIVDAALHVVDTEGVDAVTMRRVADELETGAASLYAHVSDKDQLLELVFDRILGEIPAPPKANSRTWQSQLKDLMRDFRRVLLRHADAARLAMGRVPVGPNALDSFEGLMQILRAGRLDDATCSYTGDLLMAYVASTSYETHLWRQRHRAHGDLDAELSAFFESLPADRYPSLVAMSEALVAADEAEDARFEFGLDVIVAGLSSRRRRGGSARTR